MSTQLISSATIVTIVVGVVISYFYLRYMWQALRKSIRTRNFVEQGGEDRFRFSLVAAIASVGASIASIAVYGGGPAFLYWGPILALVAASAVAVALREEVHSDD